MRRYGLVTIINGTESQKMKVSRYETERKTTHQEDQHQNGHSRRKEGWKNKGKGEEKEEELEDRDIL
jgi:hypothetical protein